MLCLQKVQQETMTSSKVQYLNYSTIQTQESNGLSIQCYTPKHQGLWSALEGHIGLKNEKQIKGKRLFSQFSQKLKGFQAELMHEDDIKTFQM